MPDAASEIILVERAILTGGLKWLDERTQTRVRNDANLQGLTPKAIKGILVDWVKTKTHRIDRRKETRPEYRDQCEFWFRALVRVPELPRELFIELLLTDDDEELPVVTIVNVHLQYS